MKNSLFSLKKSYGIYSIVAILLLSAAACDLNVTDPTEGIRPIINTKERTNTLAVIFRDAETGEPVGFDNATSKVTVTIYGQDRDKVIDLLGRKTTEFEIEKGFLSFAIIDEIKPSTDMPVKFTLVASAPGYVTTSTPVNLVESGGNPLEIYMVNRDRLPDGVTGGHVSNVGTTGSEGTQSPIVIDEALVGTPLPARVFVPEGTLLKNASGDVLAGQVDVDIYHFNSSDESSLQSFPGGFSATISNFDQFLNTLDPGDDARDSDDNGVFFTTGGFLSLEMMVGNERVTQFSQDIQVDMALEPGVTDADGNPVLPGTTVPIWSYNEESGAWTYESTIEIGSEGSQKTHTGSTFNSGDRLIASFNADHLSWWNIDWFGARCFRAVKVNLNGNNTQLRGKLLRGDNRNFLGWGASRALRGSSNFIQFLNAPRNIPGILELYDMTGQLVETVDLPNMCSTTPVEVNLAPSTEVNVTFNGVGLCTGMSDIEIRPSLPVYYRPASGGMWLYAGMMERGEISVTLPSPSNYYFGTFIENNWYDYLLDLNDVSDGDLFSEIIELPESVCREL